MLLANKLKHSVALCSRLSTALLTEKTFPLIKRGEFAVLNENDVQYFKSVLGTRVVTDSDELLSFNTDKLKMLRGQSKILLKPKTTEEVSQILKYCNDRRLAVVPQGGNTGLVGGSVPVFDEVIISTLLMNQIEQIDTMSGVVTCQSGCILEQLDNSLSQHGFMMPLDLGAKGSCQIGGNISTNAGGLRLIRYGSLHGNVLGLEVVLPNGEVLDCLRGLRKDNTGYDLKQLFIGSEGTLGIITRAAVLCPARPQAVNVAFLGLSSFEKVLEIFKVARGQLAEILSAFEFIDEAALSCVEENLKLTNPISKQQFYVLIETSGSNELHDKEKLSNFLEYCMNSNMVEDGTLAQDSTQISNIWRVRERILEAHMLDGYTIGHDVSMNTNLIYQLVEDMRSRMRSVMKKGLLLRVSGYGHLGDGNLHLRLSSRKYDKDIVSMVEPFIYEWLRDRRGSISAEHGLGLKKAEYIHYSQSDIAVAYMKRLKKMFDPNGIMNPYKYLPQDKIVPV